MSDSIPLPSTDSVDLEVLRPFRADYLQLQNVEEKRVLLAMQEHLFRNTKVLQKAFAAIVLSSRGSFPRPATTPTPTCTSATNPHRVLRSRLLALTSAAPA